MPTPPSPASRTDLPRQLLVTAFALMGLGFALLIVSLALAAAAAAPALAHGLRAAVSWFLLAGFALLVLSFILHRPAPDEPAPRRHETTMFGRETTDFAPATDRSALDDPTLPAHRGQQAPAMAWCARVFEDIEWRRFEAVCEGLFASQAGLEARAEPRGIDVGTDLWLHAAGAAAPAAVVRCRHAPGLQVGVEAMHDFRSAMASRKLHRGTFATAASFSPQAQQYARENGITALDIPRLLALLAGRTAAQQHALLRIAYEGEYWRPTCERCSLKMVERPAPNRKSSFWACLNEPQCRFTLPARAAP